MDFHRRKFVLRLLFELIVFLIGFLFGKFSGDGSCMSQELLTG